MENYTDEEVRDGISYCMCFDGRVFDAVIWASEQYLSMKHRILELENELEAEKEQYRDCVITRD